MCRDCLINAKYISNTSAILDHHFHASKANGYRSLQKRVDKPVLYFHPSVILNPNRHFRLASDVKFVSGLPFFI
jgi:hypothetical protein